MVTIPKKDFIKEHKHLIELLGKFSDKRLAKEAADQAKELKGVLRGGGPFKQRLMTFVNSFPGYTGYTIDDFYKLRQSGSPSEFVLAVIQGYGTLRIHSNEAPEDKEQMLQDAMEYISLAYFRDEESGTDAKPKLTPLAKKGKSTLAGILPTEVATAAPAPSPFMEMAAPAPAPTPSEPEPLGRPKSRIKKTFAPMTGRGTPSDDEKPEESYPDDVMDVLEAMEMGDELHLVGSMSLRSQLYAGDFDAYEVVELHEKKDEWALMKLAGRFMEVVKQVKALPNTYITDIKAGIVPEWRILSDDTGIKDGKVVNYDSKAAHVRIKNLMEKKIITRTEGSEAAALLTEHLPVAQFLEAKDKLKYHIVRWSPLEVAKNRKVLRDGSIMTLEEAFNTPTVTKLDIVSLVQRNRFSDFSCIYEFQNNGRTLNPAISDLDEGLKEDIESYRATGNYFKALKREYALAKYKGNEERIKQLNKILNSDLGRLYQIVSDIRTLLEVIQIPKTDTSTIRYEINQFKARLANVYSLPSYLSKESAVFKQLDRIVKLPKAKMLAPLEKVADTLDEVLQSYAKKV